MNIPQELTQAAAIALASPQDTLAMRVIVRRVANQSHYRLHGKRRQYVLGYCQKMRVHFIDVPGSVWADGIDPERPYEDNFSVAHDIQANFAHAESLVMFPVPFGAAAPVGVTAGVLASLRFLAVRFGAPPIMLEAIDLVARGLAPEVTCLALDNTAPAGDPTPDLSDEEAPPVPPIPTAEPALDVSADRMRKMREAKAAKKAAAESIM